MNSSSFVNDFSTKVVEYTNNIEELKREINQLKRFKSVFMGIEVSCDRCRTRATGHGSIDIGWIHAINNTTGRSNGFHFCSEYCYKIFVIKHHDWFVDTHEIKLPKSDEQ